MIVFSDFRKVENSEQVSVLCNISMTNCCEQLPAEELWISIEKNSGHLLNEKVCDGYLIAAMAFGMYYAQDVKICGYVSKKLYNNLINYGQAILMNHDPGLKKINVEVDGFVSDEFFNENRNIIGAPCSFGVDGLSTLYDKWYCENDPDSKINTVFSFNSGINGRWNNINTKKLFSDRTVLHRKGFNKIGIPFVVVDTNIHQFLPNMFVYATACYLGRYFCILNLQGGIKKYYVPCEYSYSDIMRFGDVPLKTIKRGIKDIGLGFEEPFLLPLLSTEYIELVLDGAQYQRTEKTEKISKWDFAQEYMNVCQPGRQTEGDLSHNCSKCPKCIYTMFCLDAIGELKNFSKVFNVDSYYYNKYTYMCQLIEGKEDNPLFLDALNYAEEKGIEIFSEDVVRKFYFYKWRFGNFDSYMATVSDLFNMYQNKRIILWGTGRIGSMVLAVMDLLNLKAYAVCDSDESKQGEYYFNYLVQNYFNIKKDDDIIFICGVNIYDQIKNQVGETITCIDIYENNKK